jgi:hypothetical protein
MPRQQVVWFLEGEGFGVYDSETTDELREAAYLHEEEEAREERERDIAALALASSLILVPVREGNSDE